MKAGCSKCWIAWHSRFRSEASDQHRSVKYRFYSFMARDAMSIPKCFGNRIKAIGYGSFDRRKNKNPLMVFGNKHDRVRPSVYWSCDSFLSGAWNPGLIFSTNESINRACLCFLICIWSARFPLMMSVDVLYVKIPGHPAPFPSNPLDSQRNSPFILHQHTG